MSHVNQTVTYDIDHKSKVRRMNLFVSISAALAGLLFGLDIGVISGALPFITKHFQLTSHEQEWVVSSMMLGAAIGAICNGWVSHRLGRKYSLMVGAILFIMGSLGSAFATSVEVLLTFRVLLGLAVGIASYTAPHFYKKLITLKCLINIKLLLATNAKLTDY